jgi:hypothetical protein
LGGGRERERERGGYVEKGRKGRRKRKETGAQEELTEIVSYCTGVSELAFYCTAVSH